MQLYLLLLLDKKTFIQYQYFVEVSGAKQLNSSF